jgi:hypothetical protein
MVSQPHGYARLALVLGHVDSHLIIADRGLREGQPVAADLSRARGA